VGVIGVGLLGSAIAGRLRAAGYRLVAHDAEPSRAAEAGGAVAASPAEVAAAVERVVLCLPDHEVVEEVVAGPAGLLAGERRVRLVVDTTTGDPEGSVGVARRLEEAGVQFIDAAVSGSSRDLRQGDAVLLVGGSADVVEAARDLLDALAPVVFHLGEAGSGASTKLVTNLVLGLHRLALAEAIVLGERVGLPAAALLEVLRAGPAYSRVLDTKGRKMLHGDFRPQARLAQHLKDVRLILEMGRRAGAALPLSQKHAEVLARGVALGHGDEDNSAVLQVLREIAGAGAGEEPGKKR
jgi:3-hydroxyisobutyrate dehydrogenase-like beta-hydroxyacid dehydrogenase